MKMKFKHRENYKNTMRTEIYILEELHNHNSLHNNGLRADKLRIVKRKHQLQSKNQIFN